MDKRFTHLKSMLDLLGLMTSVCVRGLSRKSYLAAATQRKSAGHSEVWPFMTILAVKHGCSQRAPYHQEPEYIALLILLMALHIQIEYTRFRRVTPVSAAAPGGRLSMQLLSMQTNAQSNTCRV